MTFPGPVSRAHGEQEDIPAIFFSPLRNDPRSAWDMCPLPGNTQTVQACRKETTSSGTRQFRAPGTNHLSFETSTLQEAPAEEASKNTCHSCAFS